MNEKEETSKKTKPGKQSKSKKKSLVRKSAPKKKKKIEPRKKIRTRSDGFKKIPVHNIPKVPNKRLRLIHASEDSSFWVNQGPRLRNLLDLHDAFEAITDEQFYHHVRSESDNDFSRWVEEVLCDGECAVSLKKAKDKRKAKEIIAKRLRIYFT